MPKFRKKPVVINAVQITAINQFGVTTNAPDAEWFKEAVARGRDEVGGIWLEQFGLGGEIVAVIGTLEGRHIAKVSDWIIRGVAGEIYPCKPDIFAATYEAAD